MHKTPTALSGTSPKFDKVNSESAYKIFIVVFGGGRRGGGRGGTGRVPAWEELGI